MQKRSTCPSQKFHLCMCMFFCTVGVADGQRKLPPDRRFPQHKYKTEVCGKLYRDVSEETKGDWQMCYIDKREKKHQKTKCRDLVKQSNVCGGLGPVHFGCASEVRKKEKHYGVMSKGLTKNACQNGVRHGLRMVDQKGAHPLLGVCITCPTKFYRAPEKKIACGNLRYVPFSMPPKKNWYACMIEPRDAQKYRNKKMKDIVSSANMCGGKGIIQANWALLYKRRRYDIMENMYCWEHPRGIEKNLKADLLWKSMIYFFCVKCNPFPVPTPAPTPRPTPLPTAVPTPAPPLSGLKRAKGWAVTKGACTIDATSGMPCAVSTNYPNKYGREESCVIKMTNTRAVKLESFHTENWFDVVSIGNEKLSGKPKMKTIVLAGGAATIKWTSDFFESGKGWKICKAKKRMPKLGNLNKK